jgi:hypothetical protein
MRKKILFIFSKRERWGLNRYGLLMTLLIVIGLLVICNQSIVFFLSKQKPVDARAVIIEGYVEDWAYPQIVSLLMEIKPEIIITTGTSLDRGFYLSNIPSTAHLVGQSLVKLGIDSLIVNIVPVSPDVLRNRTYHSALETKKFLIENHPDIGKVNLISTSVHARRSHYLFKLVYENDIEMGNYVINAPYINKNNWYKSSRGFRAVLSETLAWLYVRLFFRPDVDGDMAD